MNASNHLHPSTSALSTFAGGTARLWHFSPSHDLLAIELRTADGMAYLVLTGCRHISLPVYWPSMRPELLFDPENPSAPLTFVDEGVRVACDGAVIQETDFPLR